MYIKCPLCALNSHLNRFKPEELQEIIELIEMRSQGRARGWKVVDRISALDDEELMTRIADRCRVILKMIGDEVPETSECTNLEKEIMALQESVDDYEEEMDDILATLNRVLTTIYEEEFGTLEAAVKAIIVEYHEAREEAEDAGEEDDVVPEDDDDDESEPLTELDREILLLERYEKEDENEDGL